VLCEANISCWLPKYKIFYITTPPLFQEKQRIENKNLNTSIRHIKEEKEGIWVSN
jgi:hypothetical protein